MQCFPGLFYHKHSCNNGYCIPPTHRRDSTSSPTPICHNMTPTCARNIDSNLKLQAPRVDSYTFVVHGLQVQAPKRYCFHPAPRPCTVSLQPPGRQDLAYTEHLAHRTDRRGQCIGCNWHGGQSHPPIVDYQLRDDAVIIRTIGVFQPSQYLWRYSYQLSVLDAIF